MIWGHYTFFLEEGGDLYMVQALDKKTNGNVIVN